MAKKVKSYTVTEIAKELDVSYSTVNNLIKDKKLGFTRITDSMKRVSQVHLDAFRKSIDNPVETTDESSSSGDHDED